MMKAICIFLCLFVVTMLGFVVAGSFEPEQPTENPAREGLTPFIPNDTIEQEEFEAAPPVIEFTELQQAPQSLYTFGPYFDPGVSPTHLNIRDYPPPYYNLSEQEYLAYFNTGMICLSQEYINACANNWPNGHYPLPQQ